MKDIQSTKEIMTYFVAPMHKGMLDFQKKKWISLSAFDDVVKEYKDDFESIRKLVANQQIVNGDSEQLQAIYEICNDNLT